MPRQPLPLIVVEQRPQGGRHGRAQPRQIRQTVPQRALPRKDAAGVLVQLLEAGPQALPQAVVQRRAQPGQPAARRRRLSIGPALIAALVLSALIPAVLVSWLLSSNSSQSIDTLAENAISQAAHRVDVGALAHLGESHTVVNALVPPVPALQTIHAGTGCASFSICLKIDSAMLLFARQSVARSA